MNESIAERYFTQEPKEEQGQMFDPDLLAVADKFEVEVIIKVKPSGGKASTLPILACAEVPGEKLAALIEAGFEQQCRKLRGILRLLSGKEQEHVL